MGRTRPDWRTAGPVVLTDGLGPQSTRLGSMMRFLTCNMEMPLWMLSRSCACQLQLPVRCPRATKRLWTLRARSGRRVRGLVVLMNLRASTMMSLTCLSRSTIDYLLLRRLPFPRTRRSLLTTLRRIQLHICRSGSCTGWSKSCMRPSARVPGRRR